MCKVSSCSVLAMRMLLFCLVSMAAANTARAQLVDVPPTWGGDLWSRPRLTGDWDGVRDDLAKKGIVFDMDLLLTPQDVVSGGRKTGAEFWGNADFTLNIDTGKLGLWPGGFFKFSADSGFGSNVFRGSGALMPVNTAALFPGINDQTTALTNATFMQFLSTKVGLVAGKINTLDLGAQEFYGDYRTQFQNAATTFPMTVQQVPLSAFGGGVIGLPTEDIILSVLALDPNGTPTSNDLGHAFDNGVQVFGGGTVTIRPFGLVGHQGAGFTWNNQSTFSLNQDPSNLGRLLLEDRFPRLADPGPILTNILTRFFPGLLVPTQPANRASSSWSVYYNFDQYFWQPDGNPKHGIGLFFSFGASDGNPNPIQYSFLAGIGGKGVVPGRPDDSFGLGFARTQFSSEFLPFLRTKLNIGLGNEDAIETYYNAAVTHWLNLTADLQVIDPALKKQLTSGAAGSRLQNVDTSVIAGLFLRVRF